MNKDIKILNPRAFVWCDGKSKYAGIAISNYFASKAWLKSQEEYSTILGDKFGWYDMEDDRTYCDPKHKFSLMPTQYIHYNLKKYPNALQYAIDEGFVELVDKKPSEQPDPNDYDNEQDFVDDYWQGDYEAMSYHDDIGDR
jgi:hypothetical protein